jgi:peptide chain release factor
MNTSQTCTLLVSSGNGPGECQQAVALTLEKIAQEAADMGLDLDIMERAGRYGPKSAVVAVSGQNAKTLAQAWVGVVLWTAQSQIRPMHRRKNWFLEVSERPQISGVVDINPDDVEMQAIRAGGPGGQHQNKTSSAIRAKWIDANGKAYSVLVRDHRSQHQNRKEAITRLKALAHATLQEEAENSKSDVHMAHHGVTRGDPQRSFKAKTLKMS